MPPVTIRNLRYDPCKVHGTVLHHGKKCVLCQLDRIDALEEENRKLRETLATADKPALTATGPALQAKVNVLQRMLDAYKPSIEWSKEKLEAFALWKYSVNLDKRHSKDQLLVQIAELEESLWRSTSAKNATQG